MKDKRNFLNLFILITVFCCMVVLPGCWDGDGGGNSGSGGSESLSTPVAEENIRATNLPPVEDGELGGNARLYFDFRNTTQDVEGKTREKSQSPRDYILNSFLKDKTEEVELYLYLKNKVGEYEYYGRVANSPFPANKKLALAS